MNRRAIYLMLLTGALASFAIYRAAPGVRYVP